MAIWAVLVLAAYLLGSVPASYLMAKFFHGIDLRQYGTKQLGGGNLWRMTSWRLGIPAGFFDLTKGLVMVWIAKLVGLDIAQQLIVGSAAIIGHNWSVFMRFHGGRGIGTTIGIILILPFINGVTPWVAITFLTILAIGSVFLRSSALPALVGAATMPLISWFQEPTAVTLGFLAIFLIIVIKRITAQRQIGTVPASKRKLVINRLLFDRDIEDREAWMNQTPPKAGSTEQTPGQPEQKEG